MNSRQIITLAVLRNMWIILSAALILFVLSQVIFTGRELLYRANFSDTYSRDMEGWYPSSRTQYDPTTDSLTVNGEPLYMQIFAPVKFDKLQITGSAVMNENEARVGVRQTDGSWDYKIVDREDFILDYDLAFALVKKNRVEIIVSVPNLGEKIIFENNWKFKFSR